MKKVLLSFAALAVVAASQAQVLTQWDFNGTLNLTSPVTAIGAGTASLVGGTSGASASGSPADPAVTSDNRWNVSTFPAQGSGSGTAGARFDVSTAGLSAVRVSLNWRTSNTASRFARFQYTTDGSTWNNISVLTSAWNATNLAFENPVAGEISVSTGGDSWHRIDADLSGVSAVNNNANFGFRVVSVFDPAGSGFVAANPTSNYATTGTYGFDLVTVEAVPEPMTMGLLALGLAGVAARRRKA